MTFAHFKQSPPPRPPTATNQQTPQEVNELPANFETAIKACGFGLFNISLLSVALFALSATVFEASSTSYVLPSAECDLQLSLLDKGMLNAITYAGMIISAVPWGYLADTIGRKRVLVSGLLACSVAVVCSACSQSATQLMIFKFFGGFIACGPLAVLMSYISEFHSKSHRSRVIMSTGIMKTSAQVLLPVLAYAIMQHNIEFMIFKMRFHSWQMFILACATPSLVSGLLLLLFPESPKFLMTQGRNEEALKAFQTIYALNTWSNKDSYPIKALLEEVPQKTVSTVDPTAECNSTPWERAKLSLNEGFTQLKPMFSHPYLKISIIVYIMSFCVQMGQNSVRLWLPQIFASIVEYEKMHDEASSMCDILEYNVNKTALVKPEITNTEPCYVHITASSYINNIIVSSTGFIGFFVASALVDKLGSGAILRLQLVTSGLLGFSFYASTSELDTLVLSAFFSTNSSVAGTALISVVVTVFPTSMRTMVVILLMTFGRLGSLLGNILFPVFMSLGCMPPFVMVAGNFLFAFILSFFLRSTEQVTLT